MARACRVFKTSMSSPWRLHDFSMCSLHLDMSITRRQAMSTLPGCSSCVCGICSTCRQGPGPFPCVPSCSIMFHPHPPYQKQRSWSNLRGGPDPLASRWPKRSPGNWVSVENPRDFEAKLNSQHALSPYFPSPVRFKFESNKWSEMKRNQGVEIDYK